MLIHAIELLCLLKVLPIEVDLLTNINQVHPVFHDCIIIVVSDFAYKVRELCQLFA